MYLHADDTVIIFSEDYETELQQLITEFFINSNYWYLHNCIVVNPTKSNFLSFIVLMCIMYVLFINCNVSLST